MLATRVGEWTIPYDDSLPLGVALIDADTQQTLISRATWAVIGWNSTLHADFLEYGTWIDSRRWDLTADEMWPLALREARQKGLLDV